MSNSQAFFNVFFNVTINQLIAIVERLINIRDDHFAVLTRRCGGDQW